MANSDMLIQPAAGLGSLGEALYSRFGEQRNSRADSAEQTAKDFESILLYKLLNEMKATIPESGLLESPITKQVQDLFWYYLAQDISRQGGLGLWKDLHRQLSTQADSVPQVEPQQ